MEPETPKLFTIKNAAALPEFQAAGLTEAALRGLKFKASHRFNSRGEKIAGNGLDRAGAFVQVGRKVLVNPSRLLAHFANAAGERA